MFQLKEEAIVMEFHVRDERMKLCSNAANITLHLSVKLRLLVCDIVIRAMLWNLTCSFNVCHDEKESSYPHLS